MRVVRGESDKALNAVMRRLTWNIRHTGIGGGGGWCGEGGLCFARLVVSRRQLRMGGGVKGNGRRQIVCLCVWPAQRNGVRGRKRAERVEGWRRVEAYVPGEEA